MIHLFVALRYRSFVPFLLAIELLKQLVAVWVIWSYKPLPVNAPGKYGALVLLPLFVVAFLLSLRQRKEAPTAPKKAGDPSGA